MVGLPAASGQTETTGGVDGGAQDRRPSEPPAASDGGGGRKKHKDLNTQHLELFDLIRRLSHFVRRKECFLVRSCSELWDNNVPDVLIGWCFPLRLCYKHKLVIRRIQMRFTLRRNLDSCRKHKTTQLLCSIWDLWVCSASPLDVSKAVIKHRHHNHCATLTPEVAVCKYFTYLSAQELRLIWSKW